MPDDPWAGRHDGGRAGATREVAALFLKLGLIAFGGPAAHIALMRDEVVGRRRWVSEEEFLDLLGLTNLIPGPNSTEMAIHLGYRRAGWVGLAVGGVCFIVPAMLIVLALAWAYVQFGARSQVAWLLYGVKPVVIVVVVQAIVGLARVAVRGPLAVALGVAVVALSFVGVHEIALLFGGGLVLTILRVAQRRGAARGTVPLALLVAAVAPATGPPSAAVAGLGTLFVTFLKIGAVLYGSGYVLLAFLRNDFVHRLAWLTDQQLLDAVAIGQVTPGPVFTTATFIGYLVGGWAGALLATVGIFLPAFVFVALSGPVLPRIRRSQWTAACLDGVNVAALGLMAAVTWELGRAAIVDAFTTVVALAAAWFLLWRRVNSAWVILGGGAAGIAYRLAF